MKYLIFTLAIIGLNLIYSCGPSAEERAVNMQIGNAGNSIYKIIVIDDCQYIMTYPYGGGGGAICIIHKENCSNQIHKLYINK